MTGSTASAQLVARIEAAQLLDARLTVLAIYDDQRRALGHDFGSGQRWAEIVRVRRQRDDARQMARVYGAAETMTATPGQVQDALRVISRQRLARYQREAHRSATAQRAVAAWQRTAEEVITTTNTEETSA